MSVIAVTSPGRGRPEADRIRLPGDCFRNRQWHRIMAGAAARQAAEVVVGELGAALAHLVELPARGVGADIVGRAGALLIDVAIDTVPRGYRIAARPGAVTRRAVSLLDEDIDALEEAWESAGLRGSARRSRCKHRGRSRSPLSWNWGTDTGRSPTPEPSTTLPPPWPKASRTSRSGIPPTRGNGRSAIDEPSLPAAITGRWPG